MYLLAIVPLYYRVIYLWSFEAIGCWILALDRFYRMSGSSVGLVWLFSMSLLQTARSTSHWSWGFAEREWFCWGPCQALIGAYYSGNYCNPSNLLSFFHSTGFSFLPYLLCAKCWQMSMCLLWWLPLVSHQALPLFHSCVVIVLLISVVDGVLQLIGLCVSAGCVSGGVSGVGLFKNCLKSYTNIFSCFSVIVRYSCFCPSLACMSAGTC